MLKKKIRRAFWIIVSVLLLIVGIQKLARLVEPKNAYYKNSIFLEKAAEYDVLFFGTSHVVNGVYPMELWQEYGITSYNLSGHAYAVPTSYWVMMNALDYATPQLVVVDCYGLEREDKTGGEFAHYFFDTIPISANKIKAVFDLYETTEERMEYLWDFSIYHNRWNSIDIDDFAPEQGVQKGAELRNVVERPIISDKIDADDSCVLDTAGVEYLRKIIEECQSRDIEVLLTYIPFPASEENQLTARYAQQIAEEYGINYINFLDMEIVNYDIDCSDAQSHLNASGATKVTTYLGNYMQETYGITDHRKEEAYAQWHQDYQAYMAYKVEQMTGLESLNNYLMMASACKMDYYIYIGGKSGLWQSEDIYVTLLQNLAVGQELSDINIVVREQKDYYLVIKGSDGEIEERVGKEVPAGMQQDMALPADSVSSSEIQIVVKNPEDGSVVDHKVFNKQIVLDNE